MISLSDNKSKKLNDKWLRLAGMPVISLIATMAYLNNSPVAIHSPWWKAYLAALVTMLLPWEITRYALLWTRNKFPGLRLTKKRIVASFSLYYLVSLTTTSCVILYYRLTDFWGIPVGFSQWLFQCTLVLFFTTVIGGLYEAIYFFTQWKITLQETEQLKRENLQSQLYTLKSQVNPHFLFNTLYTLQTLIPEDEKKSVQFVHDMSQVYRYILQSNEKVVTTLKNELNFLSSYFFLLKIRFGESLKSQIVVPEEYMDLRIPPLTLQMLVENAVKHNVLSVSKPLQVIITANSDGTLSVRNNLQKKNQLVPSTHLGLKNIISRFELLKKPGVTIVETEKYFTVTIPLIENQNTL
jgi:hypothetical protein